ncbi:MAG TPA: helix-turn-helix domain-containing protein [Verrucomicrobiae bacterium]|nr:helix-turn-helix domain-containing protein [Verrucomicrobiae bacterium]
METGAVLLTAGGGQGLIRADQLDKAVVCGFHVMPDHLLGLFTLEEQEFFKKAASRHELALQIFAPHHPVASKMNTVCADHFQNGLPGKTALLQLFVDTFDKELKPVAANLENTGARERLRLLLRNTSPGVLLEINFNKLAQMTHCTPRHLSRIFYDLTGASFREKRAQIRLTRASELLTSSKSKVVEVALESGYKSLSLFNLMFARRFGTSPSQWRQRRGINNQTGNYLSAKTRPIQLPVRLV